MVEVKADLPFDLWARLREEVRRRYGRVRGNVSRALVEAVQLWVDLSQVESERSKVKSGDSSFISEVEREAFRAFALHKVSRARFDPSRFGGHSYEELRRAWEGLKRKLGLR